MERDVEHGLLTLAHDAAEWRELDARMRSPPVSELLTLLAEALSSTSTEFQAARVKRLGGVAVKEGKAGPQSDAQHADWLLTVRIVCALLLQPTAATKTSHLFMPLARVLDALHSPAVTAMLVERWGCDAPTSDTWLQFSALLGVHHKLHLVALELRSRFVDLLVRRASELTVTLVGEGSRVL